MHCDKKIVFKNNRENSLGSNLELTNCECFINYSLSTLTLPLK